MPKVSFIIPVYNTAEESLRKCVLSALDQTEQNVEIIIVDDGSEENVALVCDEVAKKDNRILVIHQSNTGLSASRNTGVRVASGDYITFLDSDDYVERDFVEQLFPEDDDVQVVIGKMLHTYGTRDVEVSYPFTNYQVWTEEERTDLLSNVINFESSIYDACGKLISRELLIRKSIKHNEEIKQGAEGLEFNVRLFMSTSKVCFRDRYVYHYVVNQDSITHTPSFENDVLTVRGFESIKTFLNDSHVLNAESKEKLNQEINNRLIYVICGIFVTSLFHPKNNIGHSQRKLNVQHILNFAIVRDALKSGSLAGVGVTRKFVIACIRIKVFWPIHIVGFVRHMQTS